MPKPVRTLVLKSFARKYEIDLAEAEWPLDQYTSLHEFFTRKLRPGARSVAAESNAVVAPSDGVVCDSGVVLAAFRTRFARWYSMVPISAVVCPAARRTESVRNAVVVLPLVPVIPQISMRLSGLP